MTCPSELTLSIHADGELPPPEANQVAAHLESCADCHALVAALELENAVLVRVLDESEDPAPAMNRSQATWVGVGVAICALTPITLDLVAQALPSLPFGLGWLADLGGAGGVFALSRGLFNLLTGGHDMLLSMVGFVATLVVALGLLGLPALQRRTLAGAGAGLALVLALVMAAPTTAHATDYRVEEEGSVRVAADESINDTVVLSGKTALVEGVVDGDVIVSAESVEITGTVSGNLYAVAESVRISGEIGGNAHVAGANVELDGKIGGSGFLAGQNLTLRETGELERGGFLVGESVRIDGRVGRDLHFAGEKIFISGKVEESARGYAAHFSLGSTGAVGGNLALTVPADDRVDIADGATVAGDTKVNIEAFEEKSDFRRGGFYLGLLGRVIALLIIGFLLVTLFPALEPRLPGSSLEVLRHMGIGFVGLVATPVAIIFAAITVIGIPVAMLLGVAYVLLTYLSTLVVSYFIARKLLAAQGKRVALWTALLLLVIVLIVELPLIGPGLSFLVHLLGVGCLLMHLKDLYVKRALASSAT